MSFAEHNGKALLQQQEGNRQIATVLADVAHVSLRRLTTLLAKALRRIPGTYRF